MFCNEHGTIDYCPECMKEDSHDAMQDKIDQQAVRIAELSNALTNAMNTMDVVEEFLEDLTHPPQAEQE